MKSPHLLISSHPLVQTYMHARTKRGIEQFVPNIQGPGFKSQSWEKGGRNSKLTGETTMLNHYCHLNQIQKSQRL